ncbi:MAG TPA: hypothetical protein GXZ56_09265 [Bacteroidales bacterium]|nr:hypothetical protein [Bacteroidales bacterium]
MNVKATCFFHEIPELINGAVKPVNDYKGNICASSTVRKHRENGGLDFYYSHLEIGRFSCNFVFNQQKLTIMLTDNKLREKLQLELNNLSTEELRTVAAFITALKQEKQNSIDEPVENYRVLPGKETGLDNKLYSQEEFETRLWNELNHTYGMDLREL